MNDGNHGPQSLVYALLDCLEVRTMLRCAVDVPPQKQGLVPSVGHARVDACGVELLGPSLQNARPPYDALWLADNSRGLHAFSEPLRRALDVRRQETDHPLILFIEGPPQEGPDATKEGLRLDLHDLVEGRGYVVLWFCTGAGAGLAVPAELWFKLGPLASLAETLANGLRGEQRRATEALALARESQAEIARLRGAIAPPATVPGDALVAEYLATADTTGSTGSSPRLVCEADGTWFLVEGSVRRYIGSGIIVQALKKALGAPVPMPSEELGTYRRVDALCVVAGPDGSQQLIVGGKRILLRGFPTVAVASSAALAGIEVSHTVNVNELRFIAASAVPKQPPKP